MTTDVIETIRFRINGVEVEADGSPITAAEILELAVERQAVPGKAEEYMLVGEEIEFQGEDIVDIKIECDLITIPTIPTQVA